MNVMATTIICSSLSIDDNLKNILSKTLKHNLIFFSYFLAECDSQCSEEASPLEIAPPPHVLTITGSLVPVTKSSPERRNQKEIVAGEERPKFLTTPSKTENAQGMLLMSRYRKRSTNFVP